MTVSRTPAWLLAVALIAAPVPRAVPQDVRGRDAELAEGIQHVRAGDFESAVLVLDRVVRRLSAVPAAGRELVQARVQLGIAYVGLGQADSAHTQFKEAVRLDPTLRLSAQEHPPRVMNAFDKARLEVHPPRPVATPAPQAIATPAPGATPTPSRRAVKGGGSKAPLVLLGVGVLAAGAAVAVAAGGGGNSAPPTPPPPCAGTQVTVSNARFEAPNFACPEGASNQPHDAIVLLDATARSCRLDITDARVVTIVVTASGTTNSPGQQFVASSVPVSPSSVTNSTATVRVQHSLVCSNTPGPSSAFNEYNVQVTLNTSAGPFTITTANRFRITFP